MTRALYQGYLKLCKDFGTDPRKTGRDLGAFIRERVAHEFKEADLTVIKNPVECQAKLESLQRLANNYYYQESDAKIIPATGLTKDEIEIWTATDTLEASKSLQESSKLEQLKVAFSFYKGKYLKRNKDDIVIVVPEDETKKLPRSEVTSVNNVGVESDEKIKSGKM